MITSTPSPWAAPTQPIDSYKPRELTQAQREEIYATVEAEGPGIERARVKMMKSLRGLSDVSQKHAIEGFVAGWLVTATGSEEEAHDLERSAIR